MDLQKKNIKNILKRKKNIKENKAITLVSLVITIVIMLILAGVSISFILGQNGLFKKSSSAANTYKEVAKDDESKINNFDYNSLLGIEEPVEPSISIDNLNQNYLFTGSVKGSVKKIIIQSLENIPQEPTNYVEGYKDDLSKAQDKSIIGYYTVDESNSSMYDFYIVGRGKIVLPSDCSKLFTDFSGVSEINGLENFDTSNVTNMYMMFYDFGYNSTNGLTELNLGNNFDTSKCTNLRQMFAFCGTRSLKKITLGDKFTLENAADVYQMLYCCGRYTMEEVNLGNNFNLKDGINIEGIFDRIKNGSVLNSNFTSNQKDILISTFNNRVVE